MNLIINHSSMQPVYEQIVNQVKDKIMHGELIEETMLPSVRTLAKEIKVSALTVKKAYDQLDAEGFVVWCTARAALLQAPIRHVCLRKRKRSGVGVRAGDSQGAQLRHGGKRD